MTAQISLRPATIGDASLLFALRNEAETRVQSFTTRPIAPSEHEQWLRERLGAPADTRIYIAEVAGEAVGQARVDRIDDHNGLISVIVTPRSRGSGLGAALIAAASGAAVADLEIDAVVAVIKPANVASQRAFERAGYEAQRRITHRGETALEYRWTRPNSSAARSAGSWR